MFKAIQAVFCSLLLLFFAGILLSGFGVPPGWALGLGVVAVVAVWGVGIYKAIEQGRQIERLRVEMEQARQHAGEAQAEADRLAEEARVAHAEAERARQRMDARAALMEFVNPN
jgi:hypothetical protein